MTPRTSRKKMTDEEIEKALRTGGLKLVVTRARSKKGERILYVSSRYNKKEVLDWIDRNIPENGKKVEVTIPIGEIEKENKILNRRTVQVMPETSKNATAT